MRPGSARPGSARPSSAARPSSVRGGRPTHSNAPNASGGATGFANAPPGSSAGVSTRIHVAVRVRPFNAADGGDETESVTINEDDINALNVVDDSKRSRTFTFDNVFTQGQEEVYQQLGAPMLEEAYKGFNVTLFAYGQTGSGKTYSVQGEGDVPSVPNGPMGPHAGLVPRFIQGLFTQAQGKVEADPDLTIKVSVSMVEIYMEKVRDLLVKNRAQQRPGQEPENLDLREETGSRRVFVQDLSVHSVLGMERVMELITIGNANRQRAETKMNEFSSRSHSILQISVSQVYESGEKKDVVSDIRLVDLAGSERQSKAEASGFQLEEAKKINHSLLQLGRALNSFSEGRSGEFLSLRESKLTRLLSDCFGGNNKTYMLATVSPSGYNVSETISTLEYAVNAKKITNRAVVNKVARLLELKDMRELVAKLQKSLETEKGKTSDSRKDVQELQARYDELYTKATAGEGARSSGGGGGVGEGTPIGGGSGSNMNSSRFSNNLSDPNSMASLEREYDKAINENDALQKELSLLEERVILQRPSAADGSPAADSSSSPLEQDYAAEEPHRGELVFSSSSVLSLRNLFRKNFEFFTLLLNSDDSSPSRKKKSSRSSTSGGGKPPMLNLYVSLVEPPSFDELVAAPKDWAGKELVQLQVRIVSAQNLPLNVDAGAEVLFHFKRQESHGMSTQLVPTTVMGGEGSTTSSSSHRDGSDKTEGEAAGMMAKFEYRQPIMMGPRCPAMEDLFGLEDVLQFTLKGYSTCTNTQ